MLSECPSPAMMPERIGIIGSTHGVNVSSSPNSRKPPSTSGALFWNRRAISRSLEEDRRVSTWRGARRRGEAQRGLRLHRHVADADVRAALRSHLQVQGTRALRRDADAHLLAIDLHLAEELVLVRDARRELGLAEACVRALRIEAEALAVHVVAVGDGEMHLDRTVVQRARREAERLLRLEQLVALAEELSWAFAGARTRARNSPMRKRFMPWSPRPPSRGRRAVRARLGPR